MRFLLINYEYPPIGAGAANATWHISHRLVEQGHEVGVLTAAFGDLRGWSEDEGVAVYRCPARRVAPERSNIREMASFIFGATLALRRVIGRLRPDACIVFFSIPGGPVGLMARLVWRTPYVVSLRGGDVPGSESTLKWSHWFLTPLRRMILRRSRRIVANSEGLRRLTERVDRFPAIVIPSGVDADYFSPGTAHEAGPAFRLIFVGRLHAQKNVALLVAQFAAAASRLASHPMFLEIVGDGPERPAIEAEVERLGLAGHVSLHGWLPRAELLQAYRRADCLVNPSSGEGLPNVVLEAMACAIPVIASRVAGNDTLVAHRENGLLYDLDKPSELADAMVCLGADEELRRTMGHRGREIAVRDYSWSSVARKYAALFDERPCGDSLQ